jgi:hypothetical protein
MPNSEDGGSRVEQEYYEFRVYRAGDADKKVMLDGYLERALIPALGRMGIDRIGVFTDTEQQDDSSISLLIPYSTFELFTSVNPGLSADRDYLDAAESYFAAPLKDPVFSRIQSKFYKAFEGMPVIEMPARTAKNEPRIFELRIYESHTEKTAALKVDMFNSGEMQIMRETGLAPVFYGEALIGDDVPNLVYMLSAPDRETHKAHWAEFGGHPEWKRMKEMPRYLDTVSDITSVFLDPTPYSQI